MTNPVGWFRQTARRVPAAKPPEGFCTLRDLLPYGLATIRIWLLLLASSGAAIAADPGASLDPNLEPLRPFLGKTWRGEFKESTPEKPVVDVSRWERALNGKAIRVLHSINQGSYGGETLIYWDSTRQTIAYFYLTTAGFSTSGTMTLEDGKFTSHETVKGNAGGVTEVRATGEVRSDGTMSSKSEYLKNGSWVPGHEAVYQVDPKAEVIFK